MLPTLTFFQWQPYLELHIAMRNWCMQKSNSRGEQTAIQNGLAVVATMPSNYNLRLNAVGTEAGGKKLVRRFTTMTRRRKELESV